MILSDGYWVLFVCLLILFVGFLCVGDCMRCVVVFVFWALLEEFFDNMVVPCWYLFIGFFFLGCLIMGIGD